MSRSGYPKSPAPPWHALLAPLPDGAIPHRKPVAPPEILATPEGAAIAGWEQLTVELSAGAAGLRHVLVVLDATGEPISAGDTVMYRREIPGKGDGEDPSSGAECDAEFRLENVGGRLERDGTFRGTRWVTVGVEAGDGSEPRMTSTPSEPSAADAEGIKALVAEIMRRSAPGGL